MGCCASTSYKAASAPQQKCRWSAARSDVSCYSKAAPPPEEETVKEVLSETPTLKPAVSKVDNEEKKRGSRPILHNIQEEDDNKVDNNPLMITEPEVSEVSDIYSLSESVSTMTEKREEEDGEVRQRVDRSPAKFRNRAISGNMRERTTTLSNSPATKSERSPLRVGSLPGREKCAVAADGQRLDNKGDISGRRSRSPATRTAEVGAARGGLGRSQSARQTGKSPGRVRSSVPDSTRKPEGTKEETPPVVPPTMNETLENPLVSLECFIFL